MKVTPAALAALAILSVASGCSDALLPGSTTLSSAELLVLPVQSTAPPPTDVSFFVSNSRVVERTIRHDDTFGTPFARISFPRGSLSELSGQQLTADDSVLVTVSPIPGSYGVTITPIGLRFSSTAPTLSFSAAVYGDFEAVSTSTRYADADDYLSSSEIWEEVALDTWSARNSVVSLVGTSVSGSITRGGDHVQAAAR
ncbi:MAG: hypothetical protein O7D29_00095 [Gemmatimonadetes bacterium]|nr:hypothetical protein [Gemmatimonadota bacterium]